MEIIEPGPAAAARLGELRAAGYDVVDGWLAAGPELEALAALPSPPVGLPADGVPVDADDVEAASRYVVCPWRRSVVRLPRSDLFHVLRTARNRHLISDDEQAAWSAAVVGVAGLSVGSSAVTACQLTGVRRFRIADGDVLGLTNLNRINGSVFDAGVAKVELTRRRILECDPYAQVETFPAGVDEAAADRFLGGGDAGERLTALVEEVDDLSVKVWLRRRARRLGIPVVMATDLGDDVVVDVERFDLDGDTPILGGRIDAFSDDDLRIPRQRLAATLALLGDVAPPHVRALPGEVGRSLNSWPQLGSTAMASGAFAAYAARRIASGGALATGRYRVPADLVFTLA